jgi:hypothetical protein
MNASSSFWRVLCAAGVVLGLCLATPSRADEKSKKDPVKGKDEGTVIVIVLDPSKAPPGLIKQLTELAKSAGKEGEGTKKGGKKDEDEDKKKDPKKGEEGKKPDGTKSNIVQVDLNKLPPDLAKRLKEELAKSKGKDDRKKGGKKDDEDDDDEKMKGKHDDAKKKGGKKKDD